ncbi:hypothetical protein K2173_015910 [Erythroxylum novogranatense]|uniref:Glyoxalase/fosfomycin resistance/dioxygenase domain-containing protein n=1 Tax=Erythroxylum novogranatense TaxID=1862640 RepID=A0AAV8SEZ8_9ROSI|nr:hypothetical protein K2173_015910 [Erythroxylum novogranatense]
MASLLSSSATAPLQSKVSRLSSKPMQMMSQLCFHRTSIGSCSGYRLCFKTKAKISAEANVIEKESSENIDYGIVSVHHVGVLCENLERSLEFYQGILGLQINEARPHDKLPYRGAWLWVGSEMIHLMELPNPDPLSGRPEHGGRDRHTCIAIQDVSKLKAILDQAGKLFSFHLWLSTFPQIRKWHWFICYVNAFIEYNISYHMFNFPTSLLKIT